MTIDEQLTSLADDIYNMAGDKIKEGEKPFAIAAVFIMIALQIYKTSLSEEEYNLMVDSISENRDNIKSLPEMVKDTSLGKFHSFH